MNCPQCNGSAWVKQHKKLTTGLRRTRHCKTCDIEFITYDDGAGEKFVRIVSVKLVDVTPKQRDTFNALCRLFAANQHLITDKTIQALEICQMVTKVRGKPARSYFK